MSRCRLLLPLTHRSSRKRDGGGGNVRWRRDWGRGRVRAGVSLGFGTHAEAKGVPECFCDS